MTQSIRDRCLRYNADGPDAFADAPSPGRPPKLTDDPCGTVAGWLGGESEPTARPRLAHIAARIDEEFVISLRASSVQSLWTDRLNFSHVSVRPVYPEANSARQLEFSENFSSAAPEGTDPGSVEVWFQDEARAGPEGDAAPRPDSQGHAVAHGARPSLRLLALSPPSAAKSPRRSATSAREPARSK